MTADPADKRGRVTSFDAVVGLGEVAEVAPGAGVYPFHCTQIAGGRRDIDAGTDVTFVVRPTRLGRWEAAAVTPV